MHAVRRHGGSLALLLVEPSDPSLLLPLVDAFAAQLRGEDWLEIDAGRLWALLDRPEPSVAPAIAERLRALPIASRLRAIGVIWRPGGESAADLALRLEGEIALRSAGQVDWAD